MKTRKSAVLVPALVALGSSARAAAIKPLEGRWTESLGRIEASVRREKGTWNPVKMRVDRDDALTAVSDPLSGVNLELLAVGDGTLAVSGYLKSRVIFGDPSRPEAVLRVAGGAVEVGVRRIAPNSFVLSGAYGKDDGAPGAMEIELKAAGPSSRDLVVKQKGLDLTARRKDFGYLIEGKADPRLYGKRELAVLGAAFAGLAWGR